MVVKERTLSPTKAGYIYGKFTPNKLGTKVIVTATGVRKVIRANRKERRHGQL